MKITVFAAGSRGDIQPCNALSRGLLRAGYRVSLAALADFTDSVQNHDVDFYPLREDVQRNVVRIRVLQCQLAENLLVVSEKKR